MLPAPSCSTRPFNSPLLPLASSAASFLLLLQSLAAPMAHHHSPSPSGSSSRRRLSELLGEQQEPFYLDLYLLEKGCSPASLDAAACGGNGGGGACSTCWPTRARSTGGRLLRRPARSKKVGSTMLRLLLSKILSGATATAPVAAKKKKKRQQPAAPAIDWRRADADEKHRTPGSSTHAAVSVPRNAAAECRHVMEVVEEQEEEDGDEEEDESSKKQLSPVSVLEQRLFERSPPHAQKAFILFSELLESAYAPTTLVHLPANARQYSSSVNKSKDGRRRSSDGGVSSTPATRRRRSRNSKKNKSQARARRRDAEDDDAVFERDLAVATALVALEMPGTRVRLEDVAGEREDIAGELAAAVLDALTEEAAELMVVGMMGPDHGWCAADTAATATSVVGFLVG